MSARDAAIAVLADARAGRRTAKRFLDELIGRYRVAPADAGLANELVGGVMRHRLTLEAVLRPATDGRWDRVSSSLQHILLVAAYQLIWLDAIPAFAAVHEAVEQAKREGGRRAAGFVNAVLRSVQRHAVAREPQGETDSGPDDPRSCIRIGVNRHCRFDVPILPDPTGEPIAFLAVSESHPEILVGRWVKAFGRERAEAICGAGTRRPPLVLRPNLLRIDARRLAERMRTDGFDAQVVMMDTGGYLPHPHPAKQGSHDAVVVIGGSVPTGSLSNVAAFRDGLFQPQDITAMQPVRALGIESGAVIVDLCAGYGTKATQAAEQMGDRGLVIASDTDPGKLTALRDNCARLGITCVRTVAPSELEDVVSSQPRLDAILVDAPCSNTGVLARRPEARYRFSIPGLRVLCAMQAGLLRRAAELAGAHTRLCYSTCSLEREENEEVVQTFCRAHGERHILRSQLTFPQCGPKPNDWRDGGFFAVLVRE